MSKRANGEGNIQKRSDGRYMGRFTIDGKRKCIYGSTKEEVTLKLRQALSDIDAGLYVEPSKLSLGDWLHEWLQVYALPSIKQSTYISYKGYVNNHIMPILGSIKLTNLNSTDLQMFFNTKQKNGARLDRRSGGLSPKTLSNMCNMLNASLEQAIILRKLSYNSITGVKLPKLESIEMRVITIDEQRKIMRSTKNSSDLNSFGIVLSLYTGLIIGEIVGLKWKDISYEAKEIKVRRTVSRLPKISIQSEAESKTEIVIGIPKTKQSIRSIPISNNIWNMLMKYKDKQVDHFRYYGLKLKDEDFVFCGETCKVVEPTTYASVFERVIKLSGIDNANFHSLRHTFATRALEAGIDIKVLSSLLGHAQCSTTLDKYGHALPDHKRYSMERVDTFINDKITPMDAHKSIQELADFVSEKFN